MGIKEEILISLLNEILKKQNKPTITNIKEFVIEKNELIKTENYPIIESKYDVIFKHYKKNTSHYRRATSKNYIIIILKNMCKEIDMKWTYKEIDYGETINDVKYRKKICKYYIK